MSRLINETYSVTLDGSGNGAIRVAFPAKHVTINRLTVATAPATREVQTKVYRDFIGDPYLVDVTWTGGTGDTSDTVHFIPDGHCLYIQWLAGDPGATATVTYSGKEE